jgi:hypothetical protein
MRGCFCIGTSIVSSCKILQNQCYQTNIACETDFERFAEESYWKVAARHTWLFVVCILSMRCRPNIEEVSSFPHQYLSDQHGIHQRPIIGDGSAPCELPRCRHHSLQRLQAGSGKLCNWVFHPGMLILPSIVLQRGVSEATSIATSVTLQVVVARPSMETLIGQRRSLPGPQQQWT